MAGMANESSSIKSWFYQEIYPWRVSGCIVAVCPILGMCSMFASFLLRADAFHPLQWIQNGFMSFFFLSTYLYIFVMSLLAVGLIVGCSYTYRTVAKVFLSKSEMIIELFRPSNVILILFYAAVGGIGTRLCLWMGNDEFSTLVVSCDKDSPFRCLNDRHLFIVAHGVFVAAMYAVGVIVNNDNCVNLPVAHQRRFIQIKFSIVSVAKQSYTVVLRRLKWFLIVYALWGSSLCYWIISVLHLDSSRNSMWVMLINLLSLKLWWCILITGAAIYFMFHIVTVIFNIFQLQRIVFPVHCIMEEEGSHTLSLAISCEECQLVKLLGFMDLSLLASQSSRRRQDIYRISHPGSHPLYWNVIVSECLNLLKTLTNALRARFDPDYDVGEIRKSGETIGPLYGNIPSKIYHESPFSVEKFRLNPKVAITSSLPPITNPFVSIVSTVTDVAVKKLAEWVKALQNLSVVAFFIRELPLAAANKIFAECQMHILAVESLSFVIVSSLTEDKYGVIQRDLADIIGVMIDLQKAINQVVRTEMGTNRRSFMNPLAISLQTSLKMAIYRIVTTFEDYISCIGLSAEHCQYLTRYKEYEDY